MQQRFPNWGIVRPTLGKSDPCPLKRCGNIESGARTTTVVLALGKGAFFLDLLGVMPVSAEGAGSPQTPPQVSPHLRNAIGHDEEPLLVFNWKRVAITIYSISEVQGDLDLQRSP